MRKLLLVLMSLILAENAVGFNWRPSIVNAFGLGVELIEPVRMLVTKNKPNFAIGGYYKPYKFLALNASLFYNREGWESKNKTYGMTDYLSYGTCFKFGPELSFGIRPMNKIKKRIGLAYNVGLLNFKEEANIIFNESYWGDLEKQFKTADKKFVIWEYDFTYQIEVKNWMYKFQIYTMFDSSSRKIDNEKQLIEGHKVEFVPGYGWSRGGVNFFVFYKF